jgi:hypothetical protein
MTNQGTPTKTKRKKKTKKRDDEEPGNERTIKSKQISPVRRAKSYSSKTVTKESLQRRREAYETMTRNEMERKESKQPHRQGS